MNELESRVLEANARYYGLSNLQLMENAGAAGCRFIREKLGGRKRIGVFCGTGNNGGDGFVAARLLALERNWVTVFLAGSPSEIRSPESLDNWRILEKTASVKKIILRDSRQLDEHQRELNKLEVIVDALLGTGQEGELREPFKSVVQKLNSLPGKKVSLDVPTGFGTPGQFKPDYTISFSLPKTPKAVVASIGIPQEVFDSCGPGQVQALKQPEKASRKGDNGVVLVIGGSRQFHGAPINSVKAAAKFVDLVYFSSTRENNELLKKMKLQSTDFIAFKPKELEKAAEKADCILIGPGLAPDKNAKKIVNGLLKKFANSNKKFVLDVGALHVADKKLFSPNVCLTPHAGEFKQAFGLDATLENAVQAAKKHNNFVLLLKAKAALGTDLVTDGTRVWKNFSGNEGMTKGGTGDVLAGLLAAFAAKNNLLLAAQAAVFLNGVAGDLLKQEKSIAFNASDLVEKLPEAYKNIASSNK